MAPHLPADHLRIDRYGDFLLTEAIRPGQSVPITPREGFRFDRNVRERSLTAAVSRERLFDAFLSLIGPLGPIVDVVLETSHEGEAARKLSRGEVELPILMSYLYEFEAVLLDDGCAGVTVRASGRPGEVRFDEHKLLTVKADDLEPFEIVLRQAGVPRVDGLRLITEGEHVHSSGPDLEAEFDRLCGLVGAEEAARSVPW